MSKQKKSGGAKALVFGLSFIVLGSIFGVHGLLSLAVLGAASGAITKAVEKAFMEDARRNNHYVPPVNDVNTARQQAADWGRRNSETMVRARARYEAQARAKMDEQQREAERQRAEAEAAARAEAEAYAKAQEAARQQAEAAARKQAEEAAAAQAAEAHAKVDPNDNSPEGIVARGQDMLWQIRSANADIPDAKLTEQLTRLEDHCAKIFQTVKEHPDKAPMVRKFLSYYLPTTLNMLSNYRLMQDRGVAEDEMNEVHTTLVRGLEMILAACTKLQTNLYRENMLDVATDMNVLEQMLVRDGLSDGNSDVPTLGGNASATAEMLNQAGAPIMDFSGVEAAQSGASRPSLKKKGAGK